MFLTQNVIDMAEPTSNDIQIFGKIAQQDEFKFADVYFGSSFEYAEIMESLSNLEEQGFIKRLGEDRWQVLQQVNGKGFVILLAGIILAIGFWIAQVL